VENVNINEKYSLIILAGQSNMVGCGEVSELENIEMGNNSIYINKGLSPVRFSSKLKIKRGLFGIEYSLSKKLETRFPSEQFIILKYAIGGSSISEWIKENGYLSKMILEVSMIKNRTRLSNIYLMWSQGETDVRLQTSKKQYYKALDEFYLRCKREFELDNLCFISNLIDIDGANNDNVQKAQYDFAEDKDQIILFSSEGLAKGGDKIHYNTEGIIDLGNRFFNNFSLCKN
jgi:hypothetical protein